MGLFKSRKKVGLIADVIRCDESSHLVWKWHPDGIGAGEHKREYAIRNGSVLRVREGEVAVFVYKQEGGVYNDYIDGPFEGKLSTKNLPIIGAMIDAFWGSDTPFQAEVYFINKAKNVQLKFGVPFFDVCDFRFPDFAVPVAVRGTLNFKIDDPKEFVKIYRLENFSIDEFNEKIKGAVIRYVKNVVTNVSEIHSIPVLQLERKITYVTQLVEGKLDDRLPTDFGVKLVSVDITSIELDKDSDGYRELMSVTKDVTGDTIRIRAAADNEDYVERKRMNRDLDAYEREMKTKTENIDAYKVEEGAKVGVAGASALGEMGASGACGVDGGGVSFNPAGMVVGMAIGSAVAESVAGSVRSAMSGGAPASASSPATPPPIPVVSYHVAKDGVATGPFDMAMLSAMAASGALKGETLVWCSGMPAWVRADSIPELAALFPPPIS